jgi:hypothetical protein
MNYAVEMGLGAMIHIPSLIMTGSSIQKLMGALIHRQTTTWRSHKPTLVK